MESLKEKFGLGNSEFLHFLYASLYLAIESFLRSKAINDVPKNWKWKKRRQNKYICFEKGIRSSIVERFYKKGGKIVKAIVKWTDIDNKESIIELMDLVKFFLIHKNYLVKKPLYIESLNRRSDFFALNMDRLEINKADEVYQCKKCKYVKNYSYKNICPEWGCYGELIKKSSLNNYPYYRKLIKERPIGMKSNPHSAQYSSEKRKEIENKFKEGKIDIVSATPTLQLGVDVGDLSNIGLLRTPPSPSDYAQRIGRAGRKRNIANISALTKETDPIDQYYYRRPKEMISGDINVPYIFLDNKTFIEDHITSLIIEDFYAYSKINLPIRMEGFGKTHLRKIKEFVDNEKAKLVKKIRETLVSEEGEPLVSEEFIEMALGKIPKEIEKGIEHYKEGKNKLEKMMEKENKKIMKGEGNFERYRRLGKRLRKLKRKLVFGYLSNLGILPGYAFPSDTLEITDRKGWTERYSPRSKGIGIEEYAPGMKVFFGGGKYVSKGVYLPSYGETTTERYLVCDNCQRAINLSLSDEGVSQECPRCGRQLRTDISSIEPPGVVIEWKGSIGERYEKDTFPITERYLLQDNNREVSIKDQSKDVTGKLSFKKIGREKILKVVEGVESYGGEEVTLPFRICKECGKNLSVPEANSESHERLYPPHKKEECEGEPFDANSLMYAIYTNVVEIEVGEGYLEEQGSKELFLRTLKNALISSGEILTHADEGEIEGFETEDGIILYDNVAGGVGYVERLYENFGEWLDKTSEILLDPTHDCESGCPECIYSPRRRYEARKIDKRAILPLFEEIKRNRTKEELEKDKEEKSIEDLPESIDVEVTRIQKKSFSLNGVSQLRDLILSAEDELLITSLYVTKDPLPWGDNMEISWAEILAKKSIEGVDVRVILRAPGSKKRRKEIEYLRDNGVKVKIFEEDKLEEPLDAIVHRKVAVIDPKNPEDRFAASLSGNFSAELYKNEDDLFFGDKEKWVTHTKKRFLKLWKKARNPWTDEIGINRIQESYINVLDSDKDLKKAVGKELMECKSELRICDPYLDSDRDLDYIMKWVKPGVQIKILTAFIRSKDLREKINEMESKGFGVKVLRYFQEGEGKMKTLLHDRYIVIDNKILIDLDMGFESIFSSDKDTKIKIISSRRRAKAHKKRFERYWDYKNIDFPHRKYGW